MHDPGCPHVGHRAAAWSVCFAPDGEIIDNLLVRIHFIIVMIRWTGLAPWEFAFPFPGSLTSAFLGDTLFSASDDGTVKAWGAATGANPEP